eukprot:767778-Hanusia_phi.AAC.7
MSESLTALEKEVAQILHTKLDVLVDSASSAGLGTEEEALPDQQVQPPQDADKSTDMKKCERALKNRLAAKRSRDQARAYVQRLESNVSDLLSQNESLSQLLALSDSRNALLLAENKNLRRDVCQLRKELEDCNGDSTSRRKDPSLANIIHNFDFQVADKACKAVTILETKPLPFAKNYFDDVSMPSDASSNMPMCSMSADELRKEKRRRQNREAQRRHRERQILEQSTKVCSSSQDSNP